MRPITIIKTESHLDLQGGNFAAQTPTNHSPHFVDMIDSSVWSAGI